ncbi:hypothetical protein SAMN05518871_10180 [Psychrobacillus sp. OK028]|uniref:hypothetical protein n=1 Tax=Psychrobacillus sp. OK028 TaxID=1884359 RepID=UPI0008879B5E|nr:hypothetical protein [Psychrobacillus sp. OK028]SDM38045.1 hypothetical protein SAMN05518871_10180 [Psychrobacillus sp. OK028]
MIKLFRLFPFLLMISLMCFYPLTNVLADGENDNIEKELDISLSTTESLFDISNMKPGDWAPRTIAVQNSGNADFVYQMSLENLGEKKLFNELLLEIKAGDTELYQGKMAEFKSLPERKLLSSTEENIDITIRFPEHLGNEFQGLESTFMFSFTAEGKDSTTVQAMIKGQVASVGPTAVGLSVPITSANIFILILFGTLLVAAGIVLMIIRHFRRMKIAQ